MMTLRQLIHSWIYPEHQTEAAPEPPQETLHLDERVGWRLLEPEPFAPVSVIKAVYMLCKDFPHSPEIEDAFVKTFRNIFVFIPRQYKLSKEELTAEWREMQEDPAYMDKTMTVPL